MVRFKHRYIIAEINEVGKPTDKPLKLNSTTIYHFLNKKIQQLHGDFGTAAVKTGLNIKYCNERTRLVIIRARHGPHKFVGSTLPLLSAIESKRVVVNTLYVGATLRQCFRFVVRHQQGRYEAVAAGLKTDKERELLYSLLFEGGNDNDVMEV